MCAPERACVYAGDGWMDEQRMERWVDLNVHVYVRDPACVRVTLCARMEAKIAARLDG